MQKMSRLPLIHHKMISLPLLWSLHWGSQTWFRKYSLGINTKIRAIYWCPPPLALSFWMHGMSVIHSFAVMGLHQCCNGNLQWLQLQKWTRPLLAATFPAPTSALMSPPSSKCGNSGCAFFSLYSSSLFWTNQRASLYSCLTCFWILEQMCCVRCILTELRVTRFVF